MRVRALSLRIGLPLLLAAAPAQAQGGFDDYFQAAASHFGVPAAEVGILAEWGLDPGEIPVVLFLARRAGVSTDALAALRRSGRSWADLASQYNVHAGHLHVTLDEGIPLGPLTRAYGEYRARGSAGWPAIRLEDSEVVLLVNLRFLADELARPHADVLAALDRGGSAPAAFRILVSGR
jgi:hypothetical protein